jgi:serine/threonine-protein kinase ATR
MNITKNSQKLIGKIGKSRFSVFRQSSLRFFVRGLKIVHQIIKAYHKTLMLGTKFVYQTVPRMLTLWLDIGEDHELAGKETFAQIHKEMSGAIRRTKIYSVNKQPFI